MLEDEERLRRRLPRHLRKRVERASEVTYEVRPARLTDMPDVREIYNHYVTNSMVTFDESPWSHRRWRERFAYLRGLDLPFLVSETSNGQVIGYALVSPWSGASSYRYTVESSIFLGPGATGKGLGRALLGALIEACEERGLRQIIAVVSDRGAEASIALHIRFGFREIGRMGRVGYKFGRWLGTVQLQKELSPKRRRGALGRMFASIRGSSP